VIEAEFLASLRRRHRVELVLTLVQLEQLCPGWWADLSELADQLGTDRGSLNKSLTKLESLGLLKRSRISNTGGNWVWWVKRSADDQPRPEDEPGWRLRDEASDNVKLVSISRRWEWAANRKINKHTFSSFLNGGQRMLHGRWRIVSSPWDVTDCDAPPKSTGNAP
jgi:hypothetical protein